VHSSAWADATEGFKEIDVARPAVAAAVAAFAWCGLGFGTATAADFGVQPAPPPQYYSEQEYYEEPPLQPGYVLRPPAPVYAYPPAPVYRYGYGPPPIAVVPPPYYRPRYYGPRYGYVARGGYGSYGGRYRHHGH
jgi:hypothetical protein